MDSYVIRVYKREQFKDNRDEVIWGVVEEPMTGLRWRFESSQQLWNILGSTPKVNIAMSSVKPLASE